MLLSPRLIVHKKITLARLACLCFFFRLMDNKAMIRFCFCDIQNNQGRGRGYQPQPSASTDNPYRELNETLNEKQKWKSCFC